MHITLFGASGMTGKYVIEHALAQGHTVRAFGRNVFSELPTERKGLELFKGAIFDAGEVEQAMAGADAVISTLGGSIDGQDKSRSLGMKRIVEAMQKMGVPRIVALGGAGILQANETTLAHDQPQFPAMYKAVSLEHEAAWQHLAGSGLTWTFVGAPEIKNEEGNGQYVTQQNYQPAGNYKIKAGDLADFMVKELTDNNYPNTRVGISGL